MMGGQGQYHWVAEISPEEWVPLLSWICGWINCSGWVLLVATGGSLGGQVIGGLVGLMHPVCVRGLCWTGAGAPADWWDRITNCRI